jgi:hypothetical protein
VTIHNNTNIAVVASALPAAILNKMIGEWRIDKVYVMSEMNLLSYEYLKKSYPDLKVVCLEYFPIKKEVFLFFILIKLRLAGGRIYFFHECCCPILDILIWLIKPMGYYLPQVNMASYKLINQESFPKTNKTARLLYFLNLLQFFHIYSKKLGVDNGDLGYFLSMKKYPKSISSKNVEFSREILYKNRDNGKKRYGEKNIIFLADADLVDRRALCDLYDKIILSCSENGYKCYLKNHPNKVNHLPVNKSKLEVINSAIPFELVESDYMFAIGTSSTGLVNFTGQAISIIDLMNDKNASNLTKIHYDDLDDEHRILYPYSYNQLMGILQNTD